MILVSRPRCSKECISFAVEKTGRSPRRIFHRFRIGLEDRDPVFVDGGVGISLGRAEVVLLSVRISCGMYPALPEASVLSTQLLMA